MSSQMQQRTRRRVKRVGESLSENLNPKRERGPNAEAGLILAHASGYEECSPGLRQRTVSNLLNTSRRGLTLIELLVSFAVIAVVLSLIVPAVLSARESARRTHCLSNLRQLGLALHAYHDAHRVLPPAGHVNAFSQFAALLPHLEQAALHRQIDFGQAPTSETNAAVAGVSLPLLHCPSDPALRAPSKYGKNSYVGNAGTGLHTEGEETGIFIHWPLSAPIKPIRLLDISDGLSTTAAFSELLIGDSSRHLLRNIWLTPTEWYGAANADRLLADCEALRSNPGLGDPWSRGGRWIDSDHTMTRYNHSQTPNRLACTNHGDVYTAVMTAASLHPGGVHVGFCDGSTRMVADSVDLTIWRALGSRAGGERVDSF